MMGSSRRSAYQLATVYKLAAIWVRGEELVLWTVGGNGQCVTHRDNSHHTGHWTLVLLTVETPPKCYSHHTGHWQQQTLKEATERTVLKEKYWPLVFCP